jgi:dTDP-4-dehydrorhamnose reductase
MDIANRDTVWKTLKVVRPWAVVNAAGYARIETAEAERASCFRENTQGPATLAEVCAALGIGLVTFSSDLVFDGLENRPYVEPDAPMPLNVYGQSKAAGELEVLQSMPDALVIRTSACFGPWDESNFLTTALQTLAAGQAFRAAADVVISPTYTPDLGNVALDLLIDGESGVWHLSNGEPVTWADFAQRAIAAAGIRAAVQECLLADFGYRAPRPLYSALGSERGLLLPSLDNALARYIQERRHKSHTGHLAAAC